MQLMKTEGFTATVCVVLCICVTLEPSTVKRVEFTFITIPLS